MTASASRRAFGGGIRILGRVLVALLGAILVGGTAIAAAGLPPLATFGSLVQASAGSLFAIKNSLLQSVPITLAALGVAMGIRGGCFNLGAEGQIYVGALGGVVVALAVPGCPASALIVAVLLAGSVCGACWGAVAGALRARLGLSEIITTIMLNFVAFWFVSYLVRGPLVDPNGGGYPYTPPVPAASRLSMLGGVIPAGMLLVLLAALALWLLLERSRTGLEIQAVGEGEAAARFAGIKVERHLLLAMLIAGALAGLGGVAELAGDQYRLSGFFSPGWGFDAVAVALIGRATPFGTLAAGLFFGALESGA